MTTTISKQIYLASLAAGLTYDIDTYAAFAYDITELFQIQTSSGSVTAAIEINGTPVTGLSSIAVDSTAQNVTASGANSVSVGDRVQIVFSSNSGAQDINMTLASTRSDISGGSPGGSSGEVQYNNAGAFGGLADGQLPGTATNDNASAGNIGEYVSSSVNAPGVSVTSGTAKDITSISLTAGDWDVWGSVGFNSGGTTVASLLAGWINTSSATNPNAPNGGAYFLQDPVSFSNPTFCYPIGMMRISLATTTTVYLSTYAAFSVSTLTAYGFIGARRVR
jgi:hypothetical protein